MELVKVSELSKGPIVMKALFGANLKKETEERSRIDRSCRIITRRVTL